MNRRTILAILGAFVVIALAIVALRADAPATPDSIAKSYKSTLARLTEKPKSIGAEFSQLCGIPPALKQFGPHAKHWVHHYRNKLAMHPVGSFPPGSVLVKEKLVSRTKDADAVVTLVAGMIKQPAGTSPNSGDWQFFVVWNGSVETDRMQGCAGCHSGARRDYVFTDL